MSCPLPVKVTFFEGWQLPLLLPIQLVPRLSSQLPQLSPSTHLPLVSSH